MKYSDVEIPYQAPKRHGHVRGYSPRQGTENSIEMSYVKPITTMPDVPNSPLKSGVLNVVGEDHNKSDEGERRKNEEEISQYYAQGHYWRESSFKLDPKILPGSYGDPTPDRLGFIQANTLLLWNGIELQLRSNIRNRLSLHTQIMLNKLQNLAYTGHTTISERDAQDLGALQAALKALTEQVQVLKSESSSDEAVRASISTIIIEIKVVQEAGGKGGVDGSAVSSNWCGWGSDHPMELQPRIDRINKTRSIAMHNAANLAVTHGVKGIWKVGDNHITDISLSTSPKERKYELIKMGQFNDMYEFLANRLKWSDSKSGAR